MKKLVIIGTAAVTTAGLAFLGIKTLKKRKAKKEVDNTSDETKKEVDNTSENPVELLDRRCRGLETKVSQFKEDLTEIKGLVSEINKIVIVEASKNRNEEEVIVLSEEEQE